jgi:hypothetical protein
MRNTLNRIMSVGLGRVMGLALATGTVALIAAPAEAGSGDRYRGDSRGDRYERRDRRDDGGVRIDVDLNFGRTRIVDRKWREPRYEERQVRVWVDPVYKTVCDRVWVEPVYETVTDRVWREPVVKRECEKVWVPACYEERIVTVRDHRGRLVRRRERVEVSPGHYETREREVVVRPGCWETIERRELVCEGHWKTIERQEIACEGHYEWRTERVKVADGGWREETLVGFKF